MSDRFVTFLLVSRWTSAIVALLYHIRFLVFVDYADVHAQSALAKAFYFITGLGHEAVVVYFVVEGVLAGLALRRHRAGSLGDDIDRGGVLRYGRGLYRILLPALVLGAACDLAGSRFFDATGLYTAFPAFSTLNLGYGVLLGNVLMLQPVVVPTFGSNGMLTLLSCLFWSFVLLVLAGAVFVLPEQFLVWALAWLAGIVAVSLGTVRRRRPPLALGIGLFAAALLLSRFVGAGSGPASESSGAWLVGATWLLVGVAFAVIAWALYPDRSEATHEGLRAAALAMAEGPAGQAAAFAFFGHFPVMMLATGMGAALLGQPLMQQPTPFAGAACAVLACACVGVAALVGRGVAPGRAASMRRRPGMSV